MADKCINELQLNIDYELRTCHVLSLHNIWYKMLNDTAIIWLWKERIVEIAVDILCCDKLLDIFLCLKVPEY